MRIYKDCYELMSETSRNLWEMGNLVHPHTYQNKIIRADPEFQTKELICEQYCLMSLDRAEALFVFDKANQEWAPREFVERINSFSSPINPGIAYLSRKDVWEQFLVPDGRGKETFDYTYNERIWFKPFSNATKALAKIIGELKSNPDTRQAVLPIFHADDVQFIGGKKRVPCTIYYNFLLRLNANGEKQLNICYHQRSSDLVTHFGNDVWLAFKLMEYVALSLEVQPGYLYHTIDSLHSYKKDWDLLKTPIDTLLLKNNK